MRKIIGYVLNVKKIQNHFQVKMALFQPFSQDLKNEVGIIKKLWVNIKKQKMKVG